jgi:hypothetical protein
VERDWSSLVVLAVGLVLVTSPFWLLTDAGTNPSRGETVHVYEAEEIEYQEGVRGYIRAPGDVERLDCYFRSREGPDCLFAAHVAQHGPVTVNTSEFRRYDLGAKYVAVSDSGSRKPFYRRVIERNDRNVTYSLEAVSAETVLADVAVNESELSPKARPTLDGETVETYGRPLHHAGEVVRSDGAYYLVHETGRWSADPNTFEAAFYRAVAFVVGLGLLRWRWRASG